MRGFANSTDFSLTSGKTLLSQMESTYPAALNGCADASDLGLADSMGRIVQSLHAPISGKAATIARSIFPMKFVIA